MSDEALQQVPVVARAFRIPGEFVSAERCGTGHIHATLRVVFRESGRDTPYIFQRVNHHVFHDIPRLMENMRRVTGHIRERLEANRGAWQESGRATGDLTRHVITLVPTRSGQSYHATEAGEFWRCYYFIDGVRVLDRVETCDDARTIARTWGDFLVALDDFPEGVLHETIPDFHHTPKRLEAFERMVRHDPCGRAKEVAEEIAFVRARRDMASLVVDALAAGGLPWRVTHNDTKANNVLIDERTGKGICVVDLDTCMPGSMLYDFGDMVRSVLGATEDERDLSKVPFRFDLYAALVEGFLETAGAMLTDEELAMLHLAGPLLTFECGVRFLTDYLNGDLYFHTTRAGQNLDRCRVQFHLVREMEKHAEAMRGQVTVNSKLVPKPVSH